MAPAPGIPDRGDSPKVTIDLQAAQSAGYRDRGVARYAMDYTTALAERHPDLVAQVALSPRLPPIGVERLIGRVPVTRESGPLGGGDPAAAGAIFHILSPFELAVDLRQLWPRHVSRQGMRTVVTVYDLIPELFPDIYLRDEGLRRRYRARRELVRAADHIMTLSRSAAEDVVDRLGVPPCRVTMVGAAPSGAFRRPPDRTSARHELKGLLPEIDAGFVVYNGAVEPRKNMEALLEGYALLPPGVRARHQLVLVCKLKPLERNHFEVRSQQLGVAGRVVLTGYLPDAALVTLYQATDLTVFPSLYEGYGLPVAEAMACGAPAIASHNSSLVELVAPEATFDPSTPEAIAAAIEPALTDPSLRDRLVSWSARPQPTWADVADRAAEVYRSLGAPPAARSIPGNGLGRRWRRRPVVAFVTPWPPSLTGVASYNQRLVDALATYADVEVFADGDPLDDVAGPDRPGPGQLVSRDLACGGFDAVILAFGNSEFHAGALRLLREARLPFLVQAHDIRLANLYMHSAPRGAVPEGFERAVASHYPGLPQVVTAGRIPSEVAASQGIFMLSEIVERSHLTLVTSGTAAELARLDCRPADRNKVAVWPYAYPETVERPPARIDHNLICTFGLVNEAKRPDVVLGAAALLQPSHPDLRLAFVGPSSTEQSDAILRQADRLGISSAVTITGAVDEDVYDEWLGRAGIAVQLRAYSNGESSGAVADCLCHSVPTVVSSIGPQSELADVTAQLAAGAGAPDLATVIAAMLADPDRASALGDRGRQWAAERSFDWSARQLFELVPHLGVPRRESGRLTPPR